METLSKFVDKQIIILFHDGEGVKRKQGTLKSTSADGILVVEDDGKEMFIPIRRIVRVEKGGGDQ